MNAISATVQALLGEATVTDLVSQRVEIETAPPTGAMPDIIVSSLTNQDEILLRGPGKFPNSRIRIECRARTKTEAITLGDVVIAFLDGHSGTYAGMAVQSWLKQETDEMDAAEDFSVYRRFFDFHCRYRAA